MYSIVSCIPVYYSYLLIAKNKNIYIFYGCLIFTVQLLCMFLHTSSYTRTALCYFCLFPFFKETFCLSSTCQRRNNLVTICNVVAYVGLMRNKYIVPNKGANTVPIRVHCIMTSID